MLERVAIPAFQAPMVGIEAWRGALESHLTGRLAVRDEDGESFLVAEDRGVRGQVAFDGSAVEAILFEIADGPTAAASLAALERAAESIGYEIHDPEDGDEPEDDAE